MASTVKALFSPVYSAAPETVLPVSTRRVLAALTVVTFAVNMIVNYLGAAGGIGEATNAQVSRLYPTSITPAGYAFSIWGFIFTLQAVWTVTFAVYMLWDGCCNKASSSSSSSAPSLTLESVADAAGPWLILTFFFEIVWTFAFNYEVLWLSLIFMLSILACLAVAFVRLQTLARQVFHAQGALVAVPNSRARLARLGLTWIALVPTGVNLGWICVASAVNTMVLVTAGLGKPGDTPNDPYTMPKAQVPAGVVLLIALTAIVTAGASRFMSTSFPGAVAWGFIGVAVKSANDDADGPIHPVALVCAVILIIVGLFQLIAANVRAVGRISSCGWSQKGDHYDAIGN